MQVASSDAVAADVQLTGNADRLRLVLTVEHIGCRVRDRSADRDLRGRIDAQHLPRRRESRRFGRAVDVYDSLRRLALQHASHRSSIRRLRRRTAGWSSCPNGGGDARARLLKSAVVTNIVVIRCRSIAAASDAASRIVSFGRITEPGAVEERAPHFERRRVERDVRCERHAIVRAEAHVVSVADEPIHRSMLDHHALGSPVEPDV
jgi:hypothetical protein